MTIQTFRFSPTRLARNGKRQLLAPIFMNDEFANTLVRVTEGKLPHQLWNTELVSKHLVWALKLCQRIGGSTGPSKMRAVFPDILRTLEEIKEAEEAGTGFPMSRIVASQRDATRMVETLSWQSKYLSDEKFEGMRRVLSLYLKCKLMKGLSFQREVGRRKWSRTTTYRLKDKALLIIAIGLMEDGISQ